TAPVVVERPEEKRAAFAAADLALAASGTVSLDLAANDVPMVIGYDVAPLSRLIIGLLLRTDTVTLVNLVSETRAVPEYLGRNCQPGPMSQALYRLVEDPEERAAQRAAMVLTMERLGRGGGGPGLRAARGVVAGGAARRHGADHGAAGARRRGSRPARRAFGHGGDQFCAATTMISTL
ncbi:hypothetical protein O4J55_25160, partial [Paracoccus sp. PXZ]